MLNAINHSVVVCWRYWETTYNQHYHHQRNQYPGINCKILSNKSRFVIGYTKTLFPSAAIRKQSGPIWNTQHNFGIMRRSSSVNKFSLGNQRLWDQLPPIPLRSNPGQVACLSLSHCSDWFSKEWQQTCNQLNYVRYHLLSFGEYGKMTH